MAEIRKEEGKLLVDGREVDFSTLKQVQKLDDDELVQACGGIKIYTKSHWYGPDYAVCNSCGSANFTIIGAQEPNNLTVRCNKCGKFGWLTIET